MGGKSIKTKEGKTEEELVAAHHDESGRVGGAITCIFGGAVFCVVFVCKWGYSAIKWRDSLALNQEDDVACLCALAMVLLHG